MKRKAVITISREYGSGGKEVAKQLAKQLGIPYYDKEIISVICKESGIDKALYTQVRERIGSGNYYFGVGSAKFIGPSSVLGELTLHERIYHVQQRVIQNLSSQSCVLLGRCSGYILRDDPDVVRVFISANVEDKKQRAIYEYGEEETNIEKVLSDMDKQRANYYNYFSNQVWGKISNYDIMINTSKVSLEEAAKVIIAYIEGRK